MNPGIEYDNLVKQLLPPHKRQRVRLWLMRTFVMPLRGLFEAFGIWRDDIRMLMNITNQVKVLEGYLQKKYNALTIHIETVRGRVVAYLSGAGRNRHAAGDWFGA